MIAEIWNDKSIARAERPGGKRSTSIEADRTCRQQMQTHYATSESRRIMRRDSGATWLVASLVPIYGCSTSLP